MAQTLRDQFQSMINNHKVMIFMKGSPQFPQCGFSARAVKVLQAAGVQPSEMGSFDLLSDEASWDALEEISQWPTSPQVFIKGEFIGGSDVVMEMHERGELVPLLA